METDQKKIVILINFLKFWKSILILGEKNREIEYKNQFQKNISSTIFSYQTQKANRKHFPRLRVRLVQKPRNFVRSCLNLSINQSS